MQSHSSQGNNQGIQFVGTAHQLSREELSRLKLPGRTSPNELYRQFFPSARYFEQAIAVLEETGRLRRRSDGSYRSWDAYTIVHLLARHTRIRLDGGAHPFDAPAHHSGGLMWLNKMEEFWWEASDAFQRSWQSALDKIMVRHVVSDSVTGEMREEFEAERSHRANEVYAQLQVEMGWLASRFPAQPEYWIERLAAHASIVLQLKRMGYRPIAILCSYQLRAAIDLATLRLGWSRRFLRARVGTVTQDPRQPALTAATFARSVRAFDLALDDLETELSDYNCAVPLVLRLSAEDAEALLLFLAEAGLEQWYTELGVATLDQDLLWEMSQEQRIATSYGRIRTLAVLLEEALLAFAAETGDSKFKDQVENQKTLGRRLPKFLSPPDGWSPPVSSNAVLYLTEKYRVAPPIGRMAFETSMRGLAMPPGHPAPPPFPTPVEVLAGFTFIRNLTSHRYPIIVSGSRAEWFDAWGPHLPAVNRTMMWSGLILWALTGHYKARSTQATGIACVI